MTSAHASPAAPQAHPPAGDRPPPPGTQTWRARLGALRRIPALFRLVWEASPSLTLGSMLLRLSRALLPVAALYVGKLIIDEVVPQTRAGAPGPGLADWLASGRLARSAAGRRGIRPRHRGGRARPGEQSRRQPAGRTLQQPRQHPADAPRGHARPRAVREHRSAGPAGAGPPAGDRAHHLLTQLFGQAQDLVTVASLAAGLMAYAPC